MPTYKTPGVYTEELATLPPSVAEVSTAIPAFIGYTEKSDGLVNKPIRINNLLEYEQIFGYASPETFTVSTDANNNILSISKTTTTKYLMYYSVSMYFQNGGGSCYIISVGGYGGSIAKTDFEAGLAALKKEDEPTLILLVDAINISATDYKDYYNLADQAMIQCAKLKDRFTIIDVPYGQFSDFRNSGLDSSALKYGAAYTPFLQTLLNYYYIESGVTINSAGGNAPVSQTATFSTVINGIKITYSGKTGDAPSVKILKSGDGFAVTESSLTISGVGEGKAPADIITAWTAFAGSKFTFAITSVGEALVINKAETKLTNENTVSQSSNASTLLSLKTANTGLYNTIKAELNKQRVVLPPSAAVAGIYSTVDRERGVWKAPANVNVASVIGPVNKITNEEQEGLNVDPTGGKSINVIRAFSGKGTLVWGARTLAGNDNEWRYVSVRRLFNLIEESLQKATAFAVFEPNDATTWLKVKAMADSYLYGLWQQGALAGSTAEAAYFINVGLGKTMTSQDVLEGRMIIEIGIAAVRPAEFIILRFSHKLQQA